MYYKGNFQRTQEARNWASKVFIELAKEHAQQQIKEFHDAFNYKTMGIKVSLYFRFPREKLVNKSGSISSKAYDLTNIEKPLVDLLFDPRYHKRKFPDGCKNLNLNDKYVIDCNSYKRPSSDGYSIGVTLETINIDWREDV